MFRKKIQNCSLNPAQEYQKEPLASIEDAFIPFFDRYILTLIIFAYFYFKS